MKQLATGFLNIVQINQDIKHANTGMICQIRV